MASEELLLLEYFTREGFMHWAGAGYSLWTHLFSTFLCQPLGTGRLIPTENTRGFLAFWPPQGSANGRLQQEVGGQRQGQGISSRIPSCFHVLSPGCPSRRQLLRSVLKPSLWFQVLGPPLQHWSEGQRPTPTFLWVPSLLVLLTLHNPSCH